MKKGFIRVVMLVLMSVLLFTGCMNNGGIDSKSEEQELISIDSTKRAPVPNAPYFRGTANNWEAQPMINAGGDDWFFVATFGSTNTERFKIDMYGNWQESYPAADYTVTKGAGAYKVSFNKSSKQINITKLNVYRTISVTPNSATINKGDTTFKLPTSATASESGHMNSVPVTWLPVLDVNYVGKTTYYAFSSDGYATFNLTVVDNTPATLTISKTKESIVVGDKTFTLPAYGTYCQNGNYSTVDLTWSPALNINKLGTTVYTAAYNNLKVTYTLTVVPVSKTGKVSVKVLSDAVVNGKLVSTPMVECGVYYDDWHYGKVLGYTNSTGNVQVTLIEGLQTLSVQKMTSSHSMTAKYGITVNVVAGKTVTLEIHVAPTQVNISTANNIQVETGKALYVTGATEHLGNWKKAYKMVYNEYSKTWMLSGNYPIGAEFKLVKANWVDGTSIDITTSVLWEKGGNRVVTLPQGSYESSIIINTLTF